ncbi:hypothetical protein KIM372_02340 [Bombiscardovia nodaiensis]|uniref:DUF4190 domain-containing protein n=1 Tax=Bombiscardovia nodaiensis TaxID=2932181 RepID=A0ABN6SAN6_9BIFI|nr:hypothetical protein KIM372_02340 [Bombiscardovia nodaiensis]
MSAMAISALVLGIIAIVLSFIPIINNFAAVLAVIGVILGGFGWHASGRKGHKKGKGLAIAGLVLSALAIIITLLMQQSASKAFDSASKNSGSTSSQTARQQDSGSSKADSGNKKRTVTLKASVTGGSGNGTVTYGPAGSASQDTFSSQWSKDLTDNQGKEMYTETVSAEISMNDADTKDQIVTCDVLVDGVQKDHKEATGSGAVVTCSSPVVF